jgi:pantoate--beta-alanine ligase
MGALHQGHLDLVRKARETSDRVVVSIFVNPTQFNDPSDLEKYPRPIEEDIRLLAEAGVDMLFLPGEADIYPKNLDTSVDLEVDHITGVLEGEHRPGHFKGVLQVVKRLLDIIDPDGLFMGQKDYQQSALIRFMIKTLGLPVELVVCPTTRADSGLALSSRNQRLTPAWQLIAPAIYKTMKWAEESMETLPPREIARMGRERLEKQAFVVEYFDMVDGKTLQTVHDSEQHAHLVVLVAAWAGNVRLIDNLIIKGSPFLS